jgi:hypothetical protein
VTIFTIAARLAAPAERRSIAGHGRVVTIG